MTQYTLDIVKRPVDAPPTSKEPFGSWAIRVGTSKGLVCEGPSGSLAFGKKLFKMLTDAEARGEDLFAAAVREADAA